MILIFGLCLTACSSKTQGPMAQTTKETPSPPPSTIVTERQSTWSYSITPAPAPSKKPSQRVNEITFAAGSTDVGGEGMGVCREAAQYLKTSGASRVLIVGFCHKNEDGSLGMKRAERIKHCLTGQGLSAAMFETSSFGSQLSTADRTEPVKMQQERRVEIWVLEK
jgi:outer membrane protein OmpA-like peptidoglycan-associated protein